MKTSNLYYRAAVGILLLSSFLLYVACIENGFLHWDDNVYVTQNRHLSPLNLETLGWILSTTHSGNWHPLTFLSHAIDIHFFGLTARYHHLTNVLIHSANTILAFLLSYRLIGLYLKRSPTKPSAYLPLAGAFLAALLFSIHPLRVESVAWVAERKDLLYAFFYMASLIAYLKYTRQTERKRYYVYALSLFFLSLASKPMAVTLPLVLLIIDFTFLQRHQSLGSKYLFYEKVPFFLLSLLIAVITIVAQADIGAVKDTAQFPLDVRIYNAFNSIILYLQKTLLPLILLPHYTYPEHVQHLSIRSVANMATVLLATVMALAFATNRKNALASAWLYYLITLLPILGFIQAGDQAAAGRFSYLTTFPFFIITGYLLARGLFSSKRYYKFPSFILLLLLIGGYSYLTDRQIPNWQSDLSLWSYTTKWSPHDAVAESNLGASYIEAGNAQAAVKHLEKAVAIKPDYYEARLNLAIASEILGKHEIALGHYQALLASGYTSNEIHNRIGGIYLKRGQYQLAKQLFEQVLNTSPDNSGAVLGLVIAEANSGNQTAAIQLAEDYLAKQPGDMRMKSLLQELTARRK